MRIATWNVNGLRAALRKGFENTLHELKVDVWLLQEVRALPEQLPTAWRDPDGWQVAWHPAEKKGYSGVAILSRIPFNLLGTGLDDSDPDSEGRVLRAEIDGLNLASIYLPSGSSGDTRQQEKERWLARFRPWADALEGNWLLGGDFNIARSYRDIYHAKSNEQTSGFLPHERQWMDELVDSGWQDLLRADFDRHLQAGRSEIIANQYGCHGDGIEAHRHGPYSWWSNRGQARALNRGWRIDYLLGRNIHTDSAGIHRESGMTISDHAPCWADI